MTLAMAMRTGAWLERLGQLALLAGLASCQVAMTDRAEAAQLSIEAAAIAAQLPIETGTAIVDGVTLYYRDIGPRTYPVVLLHGFPETGDAFASAVATLGKRYRLIVPDMRGAGGSQRPASGYDKKTLAADVKGLLDQLGIKRAHIVGHDIGARTAYTFALRYPERLLSLTVAEAFIEGLQGTAEFRRRAAGNARTQHFALFARVDEAVAAHEGKEEELILSFMNTRSKNRSFTPADVTRYAASLKRGGGLRAAFMNYEAFDRDASFVSSASAVRLAHVPALAIACQNPFGNVLQRQLVAAGLEHVKGVVLGGCTHWIFEEDPEQTVATLVDFLDSAEAVR